MPISLVIKILVLLKLENITEVVNRKPVLCDRYKHVPCLEAVLSSTGFWNKINLMELN
jgi:hypothetical protein